MPVFFDEEPLKEDSSKDTADSYLETQKTPISL